ncbi:MAG: T9SS type A sorting domain-containing protein [Ignavibacteria bacterium]|nr:T9SS type A sorting domain-containing protein [Ignavibacteria bacterium]
MFDSDRTPGSPYNNTMYISWTRFSDVTGIKLTKSINGGVNWSAPVAVSDDEFGVQGSDVVVGLNGEIYITWLDGNTADQIIKFDKSTDGGNTFSTDKVIAQGPFPEISISSSNITCPSIAADISGSPNNGNIYVAFCDSRNGDPDIFLTRSTNRGANWSSPLRVNNDAIANGKLQCWPWIEVNEKGNIAIVFYDSRNTSSNTIVDAYLAHSTDGGLSFSNLNISSQPSPTNQPNTAVRFGDYIGIDYYNDRIVPVWTDERSGGFNMECYTSIISTPVNANFISENIPDRFELGQNYPNPFNPVTVIRYSIPSDVRGQTSDVRLVVYNNLGKEIMTLVNGMQNEGNYEVKFDGSNLSSGIYFYKLQAGDFVQTNSMILLK